MPKDENSLDRETVDRVRRGDREAYAEIIDRYQAKLFRYVHYFLRKAEEAEDVVQDTFIKAYVNLNGFDRKKKFSSWIYRIAHNEAMNRIKRYRREIPLKDQMPVIEETDPEEEYGKEEIKKRAADCLGQMPVIYSEPLSLFYLEDKSYEEIGDILRLPMGTVATRISRAKVLMKQICQKRK